MQLVPPLLRPFCLLAWESTIAESALLCMLAAHQPSELVGNTLLGIWLYCIYSALMDYCTFKPDVTQLRHRLYILYSLVVHWLSTGLDTG